MKRIAVAVLSMALVASCVGAPRETGPVRIVVSFYPLAEAAAQVGGDFVDILNLTPAGAEPHDVELGPDEIAAIRDADLILYLGAGFQPALEDAVEGGPGPAVDLVAATGGGDDPHIWLDPVRWRATVVEVIDAIRSVAPPAASEPAVYLDRIDALHRGFRRGLADCRSRILVTAHDAFGLLAARYDLEVHPIAGISPEQEPDPRRLAQLGDLVEREGVTTIFTETLASPAVAETLARETGARIAVLDPIEGLTEEQVASGETYLTVMRRTLRALKEGLGCR